MKLETILICSLFLLTNCIHGPYTNDVESSSSLSKKAYKGDLLELKESENKFVNQDTYPPEKTRSRLHTFSRVFNLKIPLESSDIQQIFKIVEYPEKTSVEKAIIIMSTLRIINDQGIHPVKIEQEIKKNINNEEMPEIINLWLSSKSIEQITTNIGLSFGFEIQRNPFLQNHDVLTLTLKSLELNKESPSFMVEIHEIIANKMVQIFQIQEKFAVFDFLIKEKDEKILQEGSPIIDGGNKKNSKLQSSLPYHFIGSDNEEETLKKSVKLITQGLYEEAISLLRTIRKDSTLYSDANSKVIDAANKAVKSLRRNAADAYIKSQHLPDKQAAREYLKEAQDYLEKAISNFPEADDLDKVTENLNTIKITLDSLKPNKTTLPN